MAETLDPKVAAQIQVDMLSGCHVWMGRKNADGYGVVYVDGKSRLVHRYVWSVTNGPIPAMHVLDHMIADREVAPGPCVHGPACCNPDHVEVVTVTVNAKRVRNWQRAKTHCPSGHRYHDLIDDDGNVVESGHGKYYDCADGRTRRFCTTCSAQRKYAKRSLRFAA